jgi:hypothetical protein
MHYNNMSQPKGTMIDKRQVPPQPGQVKGLGVHKAVPRTGQKSLPVDPSDLTRRLKVVLAEQRVLAEKKRRAKLEVEARRAQASQKEKMADAERPLEAKKREKSASREKSTGTGVATQQRDEAQAKIAQRSDSKSRREAGADTLETYRHVPRVAATHHERTTRSSDPADKSLARKPSNKAISDSDQARQGQVQRRATVPSDKNNHLRELKHSQSRKEHAQGRNQLQHQTIPEVAKDGDLNQVSRTTQRHTFDTYYKPRAHLDVDNADWRKRRSVGGRVSSDFEPGLTPWKSNSQDESQRANFNKDDFRVDWSQSDEIDTRDKRRGSGGLRKSESIWTLRGRLGSFHRHGKEDKELSPTSEEAPSDHQLKSPKSGFFARFKR